jgi:hypothetical protein
MAFNHGILVVMAYSGARKDVELISSYLKEIGVGEWYLTPAICKV